jgi:subtilisin family serine protease
MINITGRVPVRIASVDTDLEELIQAGVTVCVAAGNDYFKIDVPGGIDYNNYFSRSGGSQVFYHRGSSPYSLSAIMVGSVDSSISIFTTPREPKATYSNGGPGVDVYAPGTDIMSSTSNTNRFGGMTYFLNSNYKQVNISGTSMASPQTAGICALFYQLNSDAFPHQVKMFTTKTAASGYLYDIGNSSNLYTNYNTLLGGHNRYLYNPYASNIGITFKSDLVFKK